MHRDEHTKSNLIAGINTYRIYVCLLASLIIMPIAILLSGKGWAGVGSFFGAGNMVPVVSTSLLYILVGIGFTYVMIAGNFDLSIGSIINVGACLSIGVFNVLFEKFGGEGGGAGALVGAWLLGILVAVLAGALCGVINGWLVAYGEVHSFIVTIGTQIALAGFVYTFCGGNTISADNSTLTDLIEKPIRKMIFTGYMKASFLDLFTIRFLVTVLILVFFAILLLKTRWGRDLLMTGSNKEASWQAGIDVRKKILWTFVISGVTSALAGAMFAISMNAAVPNFGERGISPLMLTLAATIIGGTVMTGGSGNVVETAVAVVTIEIIFSALIIMGLGFDAQVLAAGILLAVIVLYEAYSLYRQEQRKGIRPALLEEAERLKKAQKSAK
jgi:ribose/xylose/arabinose/galactoside ABC-type transport system permease subunit